MTVYLIHFAKPVGDLSNPKGMAQHYLGSSDDVLTRCREHRRGTGARLMQVVTQAGIPWRVVRLWPGGREEERQLKWQKNSPRFCPLCLEAKEEVKMATVGDAIKAKVEEGIGLYESFCADEQFSEQARALATHDLIMQQYIAREALVGLWAYISRVGVTGGRGAVISVTTKNPD